MSSHARVGILGGTFDPIHAGHVAVATAARRALGLDTVLLLPTRVPPHRPIQPQASIYHRFAMTALAALTADGLQASDLDLDAPGPSYTAELLDRLHRGGRTASQIVFILGADAFADIEQWYQYPAILNRCHFAVVSRPGRPASALPAALSSLADRFVAVGATPPVARLNAENPAIFLIDTPTPDVSSTMVRERLVAGTNVERLVPPDVARYIVRHRLYGTDTSTAGHLHEHTA
jgi:nicotinate-nucleotide adenylyltransferase